MSTADTYVRARIDPNTKQRAADALAAMGLSVSDAIRLLMLRIADERRLPFDVRVPNATTREAIAELEAGKVTGRRNPQSE
ncbi:type II toxin-antitoxin system RelB/DinJ family antitoxin [Tepidimonas sp.]|uniref:type II toxin-antitoxin system RelB/DinJ family antitoxin n=1 Tax=Tepidimonas sp. TaxID=2002775 RepID=UPI0028CE1033|nr:type II toxin-antitoxin system RelB/DinJ family antitoxin [Tepidimonas sp.]MDT7928087.1 type II toxin-antitoxin system RelB/DinJ family antitoxin [Tepidimonas sp.]